VKEGTSHSGRIAKSSNGHTHERWTPEPDQLGGPSRQGQPAQVALRKGIRWSSKMWPGGVSAQRRDGARYPDRTGLQPPTRRQHCPQRSPGGRVSDGDGSDPRGPSARVPALAGSGRGGKHPRDHRAGALPWLRDPRHAPPLAAWALVAVLSAGGLLVTLPLESMSEHYGFGPNLGVAALVGAATAYVWRRGTGRATLTALLLAGLVAGVVGTVSRAAHFASSWQQARELNTAVLDALERHEGASAQPPRMHCRGSSPQRLHPAARRSIQCGAERVLPRPLGSDAPHPHRGRLHRPGRDPRQCERGGRTEPFLR
jgi:hypothetical protein